MHIAIDATPLKNDHKLRGIGSYTEQLIKALEKYENKHSYSLFTRGQKIPNNVNLVHYPYFDPFFLTLPLQKPRPTVVTVHDLIPLAFADHFRRGVRGEIKWQIQKLSLQSARAILTDSQSSKQDIVRLTGFSKSMVHVVHLAPSNKMKKIQEVDVDLPERFILYVGDVNWNKNIPGLLRAFDLVRRKIDDIFLILVGKQFNNNDLPETRAIHALIEELNLNNLVLRPGFVDNLATVYSRALVYVQPSFAEGFGFPVLEAMACGCPVVCSNTSSLLEISGPSRLVDPRSPVDIAKGLIEIVTLNAFQRALIIKNGETWTHRFTWRKVARETVRVYESIVA